MAATVARIWVGDSSRQGSIHGQLTQAILSMVSPTSAGNHNKKLAQLVQNIFAQFLGEVENCVAIHGTTSHELLCGEFCNSVDIIFRSRADLQQLVPSGDFAQSIGAYLASRPDIPRDFVTDGILAFGGELRQFITAWCCAYDKSKPDVRALELMLYYKFDNSPDTVTIIKNLVVSRVTTAHNISKLARNKHG